MTDKIIEFHQSCPSCPSSDAFCRYEDGHGFCFACNKYFPPNKGFEQLEYTYEYLPWRGVTKETMAFFDAKTKIDSDGLPIEVGFRYPNSSYKVRSINDKHFRSTHNADGKGPEGCFGLDRFDRSGHKYVTIAEGELDALSLWQVLRTPVVSVRSSSSADTDASLVRSWLNAFERVYLAFDNDTPGREAASRVARLFDYAKVYQVKFDRHKDANEYLQAGEEEQLRHIWWNSRKYQPEDIKSSLAEFKKIVEEPPVRGVSYPFPTLTAMTYGIRTGESVLITAQEGIGKTELMHAIEYKLLTETNDNVGVIFLEEPTQRHLLALAGIELKKPVHLPDCGVAPAEISGALEKIIKTDDRLYVYSHFGSDDPRVLADTIRFLVSGCHCRYVLLDHITMAVSGLAGEDERRALDQLSTSLEMMVKELDYGLLIVSHVNDEGLTRGSRYISKIADIRIDLKRDILHSDPTIRNTTELIVSKNRYCGRTGNAGSVVYDPMTGRYTETEMREAA